MVVLTYVWLPEVSIVIEPHLSANANGWYFHAEFKRGDKVLGESSCRFPGDNSDVSIINSFAGDIPSKASAHNGLQRCLLSLLLNELIFKSNLEYVYMSSKLGKKEAGCHDQ